MKYTESLIKDIVQWDVANWSKALYFWEKNVEIKPETKALAIGERDGGLSLWLALQGVHVTCTDYNPFPNATYELHKKYKVDHLITYQKEDATQISEGDKLFDIVIIKSVLGALATKERQQAAIEEMYRVLKPNGILLLAENMEGTSFHKVVRKKFAPWASYWRYLSFKKEDLNMFHKFKQAKTTTFGFWGFVGKGKLQPITRAADIISEPFIPKKWKYIMAGVFIK